MFNKTLQSLLLASSVFICSFSAVNAQEITTFQKSFGTTNDEYGASVLELPDKGFLLAGITGIAGSQPQYNPGVYDILIIRTDSLGRKIWSKSYNGNNQDRNGLWRTTDFFATVNLTMTADGNVAVFTSEAQNGNGNGFGLSLPGTSYLFKIDLKGNVIWSKNYNMFGGGLAASSIINAPDGGLVMLAVGTLGWYPGQGYYYDQRTTTVIKTNDTGGIVLFGFYFHPDYTVSDLPYDMIISKTGGYLICGNDVNDSNIATNQKKSLGPTGFFIKKIDDAGNLVWSKYYSNQKHFFVNPYSILELPDQSIYLGGNYNGQPILIKTNSSGSILWSKLYSGGGKFILASYDSAKNVLNMSFSEFSGSYQRIGMMRIDTSGKILFNKIFGPTPKSTDYATSLGNDLIHLRNGGFALLQSTGSLGAGGSDFYFIKSDSGANTDSCNTTSVPLSTSTISFLNYSIADTSINYVLAPDSVHNILKRDVIIGTGCTTSGITIKDSVVCPPFIPNFGWHYTCSGQAIQFIDSTYYKPLTWKWSFGDGSVSTNQNPSHQYVANGTYKVKLTASNGKDTASIIKTVVVKQSLPPFKSDTLICGGDSILLNAENAGSHYLWNDGDTNQTKMVKIGTYWVKITSDSCAITDTIHVKSLGAVHINLGKDTTLCEDDTLTLNAGYAATAWSTGYIGASIRISTAGTYWATLQGKTCMATDTISVHVTNIVANLGTYHSTCNKSLALDPGPDTAATYKWSTGDTTKTIEVTKTGQYWVKVEKKACTASDTTEVIIGALRGVNTLPRDTFLCPGISLPIDLTNRGASTVIWNDNVTSPQRTITKSGLYIVTLSTPTCKETDSILVTIDTTNFKIGALLCQGAPYFLYGPSWKGATYLWNTGSKNNSINITQSGNYWLTVQYGKCPISDTIMVTIDSPLVVNLGGNKSLCDTSLTLKPGSNPGASYLWSNNDTTTSILVDSSGKYWVEAKNQSGCTASDTAIITLKKPAAFVGSNLKDTVFCSDEGALILDAGPAYKYAWTPGGDTTRKISVSDSGTFTVQISTAQGCTASKKVKITDDCTPELYIPNAFSPDSTGPNGLFKAYGVHISSFSMRIYNRWGEKLFSSKDLNEGWDGRFKNDICNTGTYIYIVNYTTEQAPQTTIKRNGTLYLMR